MKALYARCEQCGDPDGVLNPALDMYTCPECTLAAAEYHAAQVQLEGLVGEAVSAWSRIWGGKICTPNTPAAMIQDAADRIVSKEQQ